MCRRAGDLKKVSCTGYDRNEIEWSFVGLSYKLWPLRDSSPMSLEISYECMIAHAEQQEFTHLKTVENAWFSQTS